MRILSPFAILLLMMPAFVTGSVAQTSLTADVLKPPEDGGPRRWEVIGRDLQMFADPSKNSEVIGVFPDRTILSNLRCLDAKASMWCEVRPFRGGPRGFVDSSRLQAATGPDGVVPMGIDTSKRRARKRDFDAGTQISCAQERGQSMGKCSASVARSSGGDATVVVTFPNGFARQLFFVHGEFVRASATMSGVGTDIDWQLINDVHLIRVDDQRFELSDTFVLGGG